jgi:FixJ family two-component response regulator
MSDKPASRGEMFVVDREPASRESLCVALSAGAYRVLCFPDGATVMALARNRAAFGRLLAAHIPRRATLDFRKEQQDDHAAPMFMISGHGDIVSAIGAIKNGALDFMDTPFRGREIVGWLDHAIGAYLRRHAVNPPSKAGSVHFAGREPLTRREREVLEQFASGASNKEAGRRLGISPRTIEDHRANIMKKLGARNAADLIRIVMTSARGF